MEKSKTFQELYDLIRISLSKEERDLLRSELWKLKEEESPKISVKFGEIVEIDPDVFGSNRKRVVIADRNYDNVTNFNAIEYDPKYKSLYHVRVDYSERVHPTGEFIDLSDMIRRVE